jgi:IS30 family transposase
MMAGVKLSQHGSEGHSYMAKTPPDLTVADLERILNSRRSTLKELIKRRAKIQKELDKVDAEIHTLTGTTVKRRGRRTRNKHSLREMVLELLKKSKKGYSLAELSRMILDSGYKTASTNFRNVLYQCLYNTPGIYHDEASGTYRYKEPEPKSKPTVTLVK